MIGTTIMADRKPAIIVISSHVVRGTVGNRAAAFALEVMGYPVWIVPTIVLPWHPGHGPAGRIIPPADGFDHLMADLIRAPWLSEVGAVLSGYLGAKQQVDAVCRLVCAVKAQNPHALYAMDPVMGDQGETGEARLYIEEDQAHCMRDNLAGLADLITPNPFELGFLSGCETPNTSGQILALAGRLDAPLVLTTSAPALMKGHIGNLLLDKRGQQSAAHMAEHRLASGPPNGLGDLAAALMLGNLMSGRPAVEALQKTSASLSEVMQLAARIGSDELPLETALGHIIQPRTQVIARTLVATTVQT